MVLSDETRTVTVTRTLTFTAQDLAVAAQLDSVEQWQFADGGPDATATLSRKE